MSGAGVSVLEASGWGLAGGVASGLVALLAAVVEAGHSWPWRYHADGIWPRLFVVGTGAVIGAIVAGAAHGQMSGDWPPFLLGVCAPSVLSQFIARGVEVTEPGQMPEALQTLTVPSAAILPKEADDGVS